jgi:hypothetical protein
MLLLSPADIAKRKNGIGLPVNLVSGIHINLLTSTGFDVIA